MDIIELGKDPNAGVPDLAGVVAVDPALSAKLLKVANSPLYGVRRITKNLRQALSVLGFDGSMTLALSFSLSSSVGASLNADLNRIAYWRRSILAATACRALGELRQYKDLEELFLAALLQDIGILAFDSMMAQTYRPLLASANSHDELVAAEREHLGTDHAEVGAWLLRYWHLPDYVQQAVAGSHDPTSLQAPAERPEILSLVALAGRIADTWLFPEQAAVSDQALAAAQQWLGLDEAAYREVQERIGAALPEIATLFEVKLPNPAQTLGLLDQARELLVVRNLQLMQKVAVATQQVELLESRTRSLEEQTRRDPLTGLYNRSYLDSALDKEFQQSNRHGWPLALAFIDLDHFKQLNDTYGHQLGDAVLIGVAELLSRKLRSSDILGRYGGEEFLLVLPGTPRNGALIVVERLLQAIRSQHYPPDTQQGISVTASVGLAVHRDGQQRFTTPADLVHAADQALYLAKHQGRDQVVIAGSV
jgi:diguanylate cyclase (GGDEF)-like protein